MGATSHIQDVSIASGASSSTDVRIAMGRTLVQASIDFAPGVPSIYAAISLKIGGKFHVLTGGWIRGQSTISVAKNLSWNGAIEVPSNAVIRCGVWNNTGSTWTISFKWVVRD